VLRRGNAEGQIEGKKGSGDLKRKCEGEGRGGDQPLSSTESGPPKVGGKESEKESGEGDFWEQKKRRKRTRKKPVERQVRGKT